MRRFLLVGVMEGLPVCTTPVQPPGDAPLKYVWKSDDFVNLSGSHDFRASPTVNLGS
jgi:hypothetical protein